MIQNSKRTKRGSERKRDKWAEKLRALRGRSLLEKEKNREKEIGARGTRKPVRSREDQRVAVQPAPGAALSILYPR